jgi:glycosyltransferase involved in cell wall biosynthesis|tara:strand:+ start:652 stop:1656 length:1005 start_codon:yes stop_codon:yes gene_type:complete
MEIKKKILIIDNSNLSYTGNDINGAFLRGTETSLILLAEEFSKKGIKVYFSTEIDKTKIVNSVHYINSNNINKEIYYDLVIAVSNANLFKNIKSKKKAIFSVSNQSIEKFIRKGQLFSTYLHKPTIVTLCEYQFNKRSFLTSPYGKMIIPITVDKVFIEEKIDINFVPEKKAIYNIRSNRNLDELVNIWINFIFPKAKDSEFYITPNLFKYNDVYKKNNIFLRNIGSRAEMIQELKRARMLLYLGHKSDIFTLTVEESIKLCVPVVTYGIGSVSERVSHGNNGFIAKNEYEFAKYTLDLLNDDSILFELKKKMFKTRLINSWSYIAEMWIKKFL